MKIAVVLLVMAMFFSPALGLIGQASADPTAPCDILNIIIEGSGDGWFVDATKCHHGRSSRVEDAWILLEPVDELALYGPDCEIVIYKQNVNASLDDRYVFRVGQGICHIKLKAGKIHVQQISGKPINYVVKNGSYGEDLGGTVTFTVP